MNQQQRHFIMLFAIFYSNREKKGAVNNGVRERVEKPDLKKMLQAKFEPRYALNH